MKYGQAGAAQMGQQAAHSAPPRTQMSSWRLRDAELRLWNKLGGSESPESPATGHTHLGSFSSQIHKKIATLQERAGVGLDCMPLVGMPELPKSWSSAGRGGHQPCSLLFSLLATFFLSGMILDDIIKKKNSPSTSGNFSKNDSN